MFLFCSSEQKAARKAESCDVTWSVIQEIVLAHRIYADWPSWIVAMMKPKACYVVFVLSVLLGDQSWSVSGGDNTVMATAKQFLLLYSGNFLKEDVLGSTHRSLEIFSFTLFAFSPPICGCKFIIYV